MISNIYTFYINKSNGANIKERWRVVYSTDGTTAQAYQHLG